jgi:hypothetical protein
MGLKITYFLRDTFISDQLALGIYLISQHSRIELHFCASLITSFFVCLAMNPFDVASVRMYNQKPTADGRHGSLYRNGFDCIVKTVKAEGVLALYKGLGAHYLRIGMLPVINIKGLTLFLHLFFWSN